MIVFALVVVAALAGIAVLFLLKALLISDNPQPAHAVSR